METSYIVLRHTGSEAERIDTSTWQISATVSASSAGAAVRAAAEKNGEGRYVAIPARSFKPVAVRVETKKVVSLG